MYVKILYLKASKPEFGEIWRIPTYQELDFSFGYKFSHRELLSTDHLVSVDFTLQNRKSVVNKTLYAFFFYRN